MSRREGDSTPRSTLRETVSLPPDRTTMSPLARRGFQTFSLPGSPLGDRSPHGDRHEPRQTQFLGAHESHAAAARDALRQGAKERREVLPTRTLPTREGSPQLETPARSLLQTPEDWIAGLRNNKALLPKRDQSPGSPGSSEKRAGAPPRPPMMVITRHPLREPLEGAQIAKTMAKTARVATPPAPAVMVAPGWPKTAAAGWPKAKSRGEAMKNNGQRLLAWSMQSPACLNSEYLYNGIKAVAIHKFMKTVQKKESCPA